jgi:hypothetical protein
VRRVSARSLATVSAEILAEVEAEERVKVAELAVVRNSVPRFRSDLGELLRKVAEVLRASTDELTYDDLDRFVGCVA